MVRPDRRQSWDHLSYSRAANPPFPSNFCHPQSSKHEERKQQQLLEAISAAAVMEKPEKKERGSKSKDKSLRDKGVTDEEKELRKERKLGRKRDRAEEALLIAEQKRRKEEEKGWKQTSKMCFISRGCILSSDPFQSITTAWRIDKDPTHDKPHK
ncbi:unnamed protein product [Timema podura]|uniref:Uncharacterized protein n=1 Tax=Timema podura TaxID=61482 RepID=A0ABN7NRF0_TIMPD|nr:unnamed protein product [Timema podura]